MYIHPTFYGDYNMAHTHGQTKFHGHNRDGAFQTGRHEVIRVYTAHETRQTGVLARRDELVDDGILATNDLTANAIVIQDVTYAVDARYDEALVAQRNLDNLIAAFSQFATPVSVFAWDGRPTTLVIGAASNLNVEFVSEFLGLTAANTFGTEMLEAGGIAWEVDFVFEQKGVFQNIPGTAGFVRGEPSISDSADNFGSDPAAVEALLDGTAMYVGAAIGATIPGDLESMTDADTSALFVDGINFVTGVAGAFADTTGDEVSIVAAGNAVDGTSQTVVIEVVGVAPDTQS